MEPHISQHWILGQVTTTYHLINLSIPKTAFNSPFRKFEYVKVPFGLAQAPAYFQELMTGILKDFNFAIAYLDDIIIFSKTPQECLLHIRMVFEQTQISKPFHEKEQVQFFLQRNSISRTHPQCYRYQNHYLPRHTPYNICNHKLHPNKLEPFLAWSDIIESSSRDLQK